MTTIVYNHDDGEVALDSRLTMSCGVIVSDDGDKSYSADGRVFFMCGSTSEAQEFTRIYPEANGNEFCCSGIMIEDGIAYLVFHEDGQFSKEQLFDNSAIGSGRDFAISALDLVLKCTAENAVNYAMKRDSRTGGKVRVFSLLGEEVTK